MRTATITFFANDPRKTVATWRGANERVKGLLVDDLMFEPFGGGNGADVVQDCRACLSAL